MKIVEDELENQKKQALSLALVFSKNQDIVKNLDDNNSKELKKELLKLLEIIKAYTNQDIDVQIHTKNLEVFTRSWEDKDFGENLTSFREGLVKVKSSNKPFVSNELGKRFNVKAIAPIYDKNNEFLGSIEIIIDFKDFIYRLKNLGISSMILLEKDFLNIATSYKENKHIEEFVLLQNSFDKFNKELIKEVLNSDKLFIEQDSKIYSKIPLGNFGNKNAGVLVVCFEKFVKNFVYLPNYNYHGEFNLNDSERKYNNINKEIIIK